MSGQCDFHADRWHEIDGLGMAGLRMWRISLTLAGRRSPKQSHKLTHKPRQRRGMAPQNWGGEPQIRRFRHVDMFRFAGKRLGSPFPLC